MRTKLGTILAVFGTVSVALAAPPALAAYITVYGGPTYSPGPGGIAISGGGDVAGVNDAGTVVGSTYRYDSSGASLGLRAVRWDGSGAAAVELENLSTGIAGYTQTQAAAINNSGAVVGKSRLYFTSDIGDRSVRWNSSGAAVSMLDQLSTAATAFTVRFISEALAINDAGTAVGSAYKVLREGGSFSDYKGTRAVRWSPSSTAVTELGNLGTDTSGVTYGSAFAINTAGAAVGYAQKFTGAGADLGYRAVRWNPGGTAATELEHLGTDPNGYTFSGAQAVNDAGIAVGYANKYDASGANIGSRAVRWNAGGTAATELGNLGTDLTGSTGASALVINSAGTAIGSASKFDASGTALGERAVRWDASGTAATELGNLPGYTHTSTENINDAGTAVGSVKKYDAGMLLAAKAVYWGFDALPVDLNTLIDPASGWTLNYATRISDTGWIGGGGTFDPDGPGGQAAYERLFLIHVPATAIPEPTTAVLFGVALAAMFGSLSQRSNSPRTGRRTDHRQAVRRPRLEPLEDRCLLSFSSTWPFPPPEDPDTHIVWAPPPPLVADFTSDGILDKISSNLHEVIVRPGRSDGTFGDPIQSAIHPAWGAPALAVADFSNDGRLDVVTFDWDYHDNYGIANVVLGSGNGRFSLWETLEFGTDYSGVLGTGDINRDGLRDVAIAAGHDPDTGEPYLTALFNDGNWPSVEPALPGDYNRNGTVDAADYTVWRNTLGTSRPNYSGADGNGNGVVDQDDHAVWRVHFGETLPAVGAGSLVSAVPEPATVVLFGVALAAMFGSLSQRSNSRRTGRRTDHRHAVRRPSFEPLEDRCLLSFSPAISYPVGANPQSVVTGDFNNDAKLDLATANANSLSVLLGDGHGGFGAARQSAVGHNINSLVAADFNKDGKFDLAWVNNYYEEGYTNLNVALSNGDGTFKTPTYPTVLWGPLTLAVGDFNHDGKTDLAVSESDYNSFGYFEALMGNGKGGFTQAEGRYNSYPTDGGLAVGDLDRDGALDVVTSLGSRGAFALMNTGAGSFTGYDERHSAIDSGPVVAVGDYTGDGIPDVVSCGSGSVFVVPGRGDGEFDPPLPGTPGGPPLPGTPDGSKLLVAADFNGDGKLDAVTLEGDTVRLVLGNGDGTLRDGGSFAVGSAPSSIATGDFNADGRPDVAAANVGSNNVSVLLNDGNWTATSPALPGDYNGDRSVNAADYTVWRNTLGSTVARFSGADGNGNSVVDQDDYGVWRANFGQTLPAVGAGSLVTAAPTTSAELSASVEAVEVMERASASVEPAEPDERGSIEPQGTSARDSALAVLDSRLAQFVPQGRATMRRLHALSTTDSGINARVDDLLLVRSSAASFDQQPSKRGLDSRSINNSTEEAVDTRSESLDIAFANLEHAGWQLGGSPPE